MAEKKISPIVKLTPEIKRSLMNLEADIKGARKALAVMKELGLEVKPIEDKLEWSEKVKNTLLEEFG